MKNSPSLRGYESKLMALYGLFQLFVLPLLASFINLFLALSDWQLQFGVFCLNFLCSSLICIRFLGSSFDAFCDAPGKVFSSAGLGLLLYYSGTIAITVLILVLRPDYLNLNNGSISQLLQENRGLMFLAIVILAPVAEELLFRGLLFRGLYDRNALLGWSCSVLSFAAVHVLSYIGQYDLIGFLLATLQYLPAGLALCYAYRRSGSIFAPMLMHIFINLLAYIAI